MRNLIGLEMVCFARSRHFELQYANGGYVDEKQEPVAGLMDMCCYKCSTSYYTLEADGIDYCPNCGDFERKRFAEFEDLVTHLQGCDFSWLAKARLQAAFVHTHEGDWQLRFTRDLAMLEASGKYREIRRR
jgi:hypothetical protein